MSETLYSSDLHPTSCEPSIITSWFPLGNSTLSKEHCKKLGKTIKIYCNFLLNTQSQTQAVTECLHCLLQSTGSSSVSDDFETNLSKKTWCGASADEQKVPWVHSPRRGISRWAQADTWSGTHLRVLPGYCHRGDEDRSPSAQHPPPTGHSELLCLKVFPLTVLLSSKATTVTASGREQAQVSTCAKFPKGITLQVQSHPVRRGWPGRQNYFF